MDGKVSPFIIIRRMRNLFLTLFSRKKYGTGISNKDLAQIREQMLKFATLQVGDSVLAEDLVQESFLSAFNHLELNLNDKRHLRPGSLLS